MPGRKVLGWKSANGASENATELIITKHGYNPELYLYKTNTPSIGLESMHLERPDG